MAHRHSIPRHVPRLDLARNQVLSFLPLGDAREGLEEAGAMPARTRRCDRGRRPHEATAGSPAGRRGLRTIRKPEDLSPSALATPCVVNGAAAAHAVVSNTGGPGQTKCRPGLCRSRGRKAVRCRQLSSVRWAAASSSKRRSRSRGCRLRIGCGTAAGVPAHLTLTAAPVTLRRLSLRCWEAGSESGAAPQP